MDDATDDPFTCTDHDAEDGVSLKNEDVLRDLLSKNGAPSSMPKTSLGDEVGTSTPPSRRSVSQRAQQATASVPPVPIPGSAGSKHFTSISQIVLFKMKTQVGRAAMGLIPLAKRVVCAVAGVVVDATRDPFAQQALVETQSGFEHVEVSGIAGDVKTVHFYPQGFFQSEHLRMTDSFEVPGRGTRVLGWYVGADPQLNVDLKGGIWTSTFADCPFKSRTCEPGLKISFTVSFVEDCTWECDVLGKLIKV